MVLAILSGEVLTKTREVNQYLANYDPSLPQGNDTWQQYERLRSRVESIIRNIPRTLHPTITTDPLALHVNMSFYSFSISLDQAMLDTVTNSTFNHVDPNRIRARQKAAATAIVKITDIAIKKGIGINRVGAALNSTGLRLTSLTDVSVRTCAPVHCVNYFRQRLQEKRH